LRSQRLTLAKWARFHPVKISGLSEYPEFQKAVWCKVPKNFI
jgi:hypothetical protein